MASFDIRGVGILLCASAFCASTAEEKEARQLLRKCLILLFFLLLTGYFLFVLLLLLSFLIANATLLPSLSLLLAPIINTFIRSSIFVSTHIFLVPTLLDVALFLFLLIFVACVNELVHIILVRMVLVLLTGLVII